MNASLREWGAMKHNQVQDTAEVERRLKSTSQIKANSGIKNTASD